MAWVIRLSLAQGAQIFRDTMSSMILKILAREIWGMDELLLTRTAHRAGIIKYDR